MFGDTPREFDFTPTGRRMGRLQGKLDDIAGELYALQSFELKREEPDPEVLAALDLMAGSLSNMAEGVETAIGILNTQGRR